MACSRAIEAAQAIAEAVVEAIATRLHELAPRNSGRITAEQLVQLAKQEVRSTIATSARSTSLKIRMPINWSIREMSVAQLEEEIDKLVEHDDGIKGLKSVPEDAA